MEKIINWLSKSDKLLRLARYRNSRKTEALIRNNSRLWPVLSEYLQKTKSTGCSFSDYFCLYDYVSKKAPSEILECGTGSSTLVLAQAILDNNLESRIVSMESNPHWFEQATTLLPERYKDIVEIRYSPVVDDTFSFFRGVRYRDTPLDRAFDFVFVDGPSTTSTTDNTKSFNFDFVYLAKNSDTPISAIIDGRLGSVWVYQKLFGNKVYYDGIRKIGIVNSVSRNDLKHVSRLKPGASIKGASIFGGNKLRLDYSDSYLNYLENTKSPRK